MEASAEDGFFIGSGPEMVIDGRLDTRPFSSKSGKYPWLSLRLGQKPWRVMTKMTTNRNQFDILVDKILGVTMVERSDWADGPLRTRNIRVTIGDKEPQPGDDENVITGNLFYQFDRN